MTPEDARRFALSLPGVSEQPHFDKWSFRVRGKIFATLPPDDAHLHVFAAEDDVPGWIAAAPDAVEELRWGKKLSGVRVRLAAATPDLVTELLEDSWRRRAPKRVVAAFDEPQQGG